MFVLGICYPTLDRRGTVFSSSPELLNLFVVRQKLKFSQDNFNTCDDCGGCCCVDSWTDHAKVRNCPLSGLIDLNLAVDDTVTKVVK